MKVLLIPCGDNGWRGAGRLLGRAELSLTDAGASEVRGWVRGWSVEKPSRIYHAPDDLSAATARLLASGLDVSAKSAGGLTEIDLGLWSGLTEAELKSRYAKAYRQLDEAPFSVAPPDGEVLRDGTERIEAALRRLLKRNGKCTLAFVLRPMALAAGRAALEQTNFDFWAGYSVTAPLLVEPQATKPVAAAARPADAGCNAED